MAKELLKRSEVKEEYTWNLKDMYASDEDWKKDLDEIDKILDEIGKMEGKVAACAQNLLFVLERVAKAEEKLDYDFTKADKDSTMANGVIARTIVLDGMVNDYLNTHSDTIVVNIGCGMDTRCYRMQGKYKLWYNVDLPETINIRTVSYTHLTLPTN